MTGEDSTKEQLIHELDQLRIRISELEGRPAPQQVHKPLPSSGASGLERVQQRVLALSRTAAKVQRVLEPDRVFETMGDELRSLGLNCLFGLTDDSGDRIVLRYTNLDPESQRTAGKLSKDWPVPFSFSVDDSPHFQTVVREGNPLFESQAIRAIKAVAPGPVKELAFRLAEIVKLRQAISAPLIAGQDILGVLTVWSDDLTADDVPAISIFAQQAAMALENAKLYQEEILRVFQMEALRSTTLDITRRLDLSELLHSIVQRAAGLMKTKGGALYIYHPDQQEVEMVESFNLGKDYTGTRLKLGEGLSGRVAQTTEPLIVEDYANWEGKSDKFDYSNIRGVMGVPLKWRNQIVGVLNVTDVEQPRHFSTGDLRLLELFASQAAIAIENARLYEEQRRRLSEMTGLYETSLDIVRELEVEDLLRSITERATHLLGAAAGATYLYKPDDKELELVIDHNQPQDLAGTRWKVGEGLSGKVMQTGQPLIVEDYTNWQGRSERVDSIPIKAIIGVPLKWGEEIIGVLSVNEVYRSRRFDEHDLRLLTHFANQAAVAIKNAQLFAERERTIEQLQALHDVSLEVVAKIDLSEVLLTIVQKAAQLLEADCGGIDLFDPETQKLELQVADGYSKDYTGTTLALGEGVAGVIAQSRQPLLLDDYDQWPGRSPLWKDENVKAVLGVPLNRGDQLLGVLTIDRRVSRPFDEKDLQVATLFAAQAAIAIENARLYEETSRSLQELSILHGASVAATSTLDVSEIVERIVAVLRQTLDLTLLTLWLIDDDGETLKIMAGSGYPADFSEITELRLGEGITGHVASTGQPINVPDARADPRYIIASEAVRSELCVPLKVGNRVIGVLDLESAEPAAFTSDDLRLLSTLAGQLAVVIENVRLYQDAESERYKLAAIMSGMHDGVDVVGPDYVVKFQNRVLRERFGDLTGQLCYEGYIGRDEPCQSCPMVEATRTGSIEKAELQARDGRDYEIVAVPLRNSGGNVDAIEVVRDVTERKQAREQLLREKERFQALVENSPFGVAIIQKDGRYQYVNSSFVKIFGYTMEDIRSSEEWFVRAYPDAEEREKAVALWTQDLAESPPGEVRARTLTVTCKDGSEKVIEFRPVTMESGDQFVTYEDITDRVRAADDLTRSYERLGRTLDQTVHALAALAERRDPYTAGHQRRVATLARAIAEQMGLSEDQIRGLHMAGLIHDIGKVYVPAEILSKPTQLSEIEFNMIKTHAHAGYEILNTVEFPWPVAQIVLQHHERMNGSGYPHGLAGDEILLEARILAVADVVEAMASHRPYRPARTVGEALREILDKKGTLYDPLVVDACVALFNEKGFLLTQEQTANHNVST
jgi:PAS domain S-box-containing protein/putative nucleotidyltransferase with HDIG domain